VGLAALFLLTALVYASVGLGGGSTYSALLVLSGSDYRAIPTISLLCNIAVVTVGSWRFGRDGFIRWRRIWPLFTLSVPFAWIGGRMAVPEMVFTILLAASLAAAALAMLLQRSVDEAAPEAPRAIWLEPAIGGALGLLSGIVGIGGGIFLAPVLHLMRWAGAKVIAATCAVFILVNSVAGLAGQLGKADGFDRLAAIEANWPLFPAVLAGGLAGATIGSLGLKAWHVRILTALLVLYVAGRLALRSWTLAGGPP
jgi:hypothetical protein